MRPIARDALSAFVRQVGCAGASDGRSDEQLLQRFVLEKDEDAFATLMRRHVATVWGVCRRILNQDADAEDAAQATFVVFARRAASLRHPNLVGAWLHGVARKVALRQRQRSLRRGATTTSPPNPPTDPLDSLTARELLAVLDEELSCLADKYRAPLILCCIEGRSREEAANQLGWSPGSVKGRLERGRELLARRLARRGVSLNATLGAILVWRATTHAMTLPATTLAGVSPAVLALADQVGRDLSKALLLSRTAATGLVLLGGLVVAAIGGVWSPDALPARAGSALGLPPPSSSGPNERVVPNHEWAALPPGVEQVIGDIASANREALVVELRRSQNDSVEDAPKPAPRSLAVNPSTRVTWGDKPATLAELRRGQRVMVTVDADGRTAEAVEIVTPRKGSGKPEGKEARTKPRPNG